MVNLLDKHDELLESNLLTRCEHCPCTLCTQRNPQRQRSVNPTDAPSPTLARTTLYGGLNAARSKDRAALPYRSAG